MPRLWAIASAQAALNSSIKLISRSGRSPISHVHASMATEMVAGVKIS